MGRETEGKKGEKEREKRKGERERERQLGETEKGREAGRRPTDRKVRQRQRGRETNTYCSYGIVICIVLSAKQETKSLLSLKPARENVFFFFY